MTHDAVARFAELGFDAERQLNPTQERFIAALDRFEQRLHGAAPDSFSAPAALVEVNDANLLLPVIQPEKPSPAARPGGHSPKEFLQAPGSS